jgi:hypothetical protein
MFSYLLTRQQGAFAPGDPNTQATALAARISRALVVDPGPSSTTWRARARASTW